MATAYLDFVKDADQASRRAELMTFFGPHADKLIRSYDAQAAITNRAPGEKIKFSLGVRNYIWPAFFVGPVWFFYRKMWWWGIGTTVVLIILGRILPDHVNIGIPVGVAFAFGGGSLYLDHAIRTIEKLRRQSPGGVLDPARLAAAGGVSKTAGWIGGILYVLLTGVFIASVVMGVNGTLPAR